MIQLQGIIFGVKQKKTKSYQLSYPQNTSSVFQAELASEINFPLDPDDDKPQNYIRSGSISLGESEILVKSLFLIFIIGTGKRERQSQKQWQ